MWGVWCALLLSASVLTRCGADGECPATQTALGASYVSLGCGLGARWLSDDGLHLLEPLDLGGKKVVLVDGRTGPEYDDITDIAISADGRRTVYAARRGEKSVAVVDGQEGPEYDDLGSLVLSRDGRHLAYTALNGNRSFVVRDGMPLPTEGKVVRGAMSPDGRRLTWVEWLRDAPDRCTVRDGREPLLFDWISLWGYSPDGSALYWIGMRNNQYACVLDGTAGPEYAYVWCPTFSPDGKHLAYIGVAAFADRAAGRRTGGRSRVVVDGVEGPEYRWIGPSDGGLGWSARPVWSTDSTHLAYVAKKGDRFVAVVDGREGRDYAWVSNPCFSADGRRVLYKACRQAPSAEHAWHSSGSWVAVVDGAESAECDEVLSHSNLMGGWELPTFSPDGRRVAYAARRGRECFAVIDDQEGPTYQRVEPPLFSPDSRRVAYEACGDQGESLVVDGVAGPSYGNVWQPLFSPDSQRVAYTAERYSHGQQTWLVVVDGREEAASRPWGIFLSPDNRHIAYLTSVGTAWRSPWHSVVIDGKGGPRYDDIITPHLTFDRTGAVRYLARRTGVLYWVAQTPPAG